MSSVFLNVPFAEKDSAKALGARWHPQQRKWYVPVGTELEPFARWMPPAVTANGLALTAENTAPYGLTTLPGLPLSQLMERVRALIHTAFNEGVWTLVEVSNAQARNGHVYLELAERDAMGQVLAQARGMIWATRAAHILPEFQRATGVEVAAGIKLLVRARPVFHERFGLSLEIDAIDPDYTLGDLEAKKKQIRLRLQQEGIFTANQQLAAPWDFNHVLVVSPENAAGLGDFRAEAQRLTQFGLCRFSYVHSRFQGEGAGDELSQTLQQAVQHSRQSGEILDAVVIIRGGGAVNDLAWLNDYGLARAICLLDIPVLTGIGHERDSTVLDEVAHHSFDTPSKVIAGIEQRIAQRAQEARAAFQQVQTWGVRILQMRRLQLEQQHAAVQQGARRVLADTRQRTSESFHAVRVSALGQIQEARNSSRTCMEQTRAQAQQQLNVAHGQVPMLLAQVRDRAEARLAAARQQTGNDLAAVLQLGRQQVRHCAQVTDQSMAAVAHEAQRTLNDARAVTMALFREVTGQGPEKTLQRGFALLRNEQGQPVSSVAAVQPGQLLAIELKDGCLHTRVASVTGEAYFE